MNLFDLYRKFQKGVAYFKDKWNRGLNTPPVMAQLSVFEREVIKPFDDLCRTAKPEELAALEEQI